MSRFVDAIITYRILKKLVTPFEETDAYKLGVIDKKGNLIVKNDSSLSQPQKDSYTILDRLVFRLKRIINKVPVENKRLLSMAAALTLIRECLEADREPINLEQQFFGIAPTPDTLNEVHDFMDAKLKSFSMFLEDGMGGAANSVGGGFSGQATANPNPNLAGHDIVMGKMARRKKPQLIGMKIKNEKA